jgi:ribosomal subunit interface protein
MDIKILAKKLELTDKLKDYIVKRVTNLGKILKKIEDKGGEVKINFEVSKSTKHHKSGDIFHADCTIKIDGKKFYLSADKSDIYEAIDVIKDGLFREISQKKDKTQTLARRGEKSVKKMMKKISKRNPETGKY